MTKRSISNFSDLFSTLRPSIGRMLLLIFLIFSLESIVMMLLHQAVDNDSYFVWVISDALFLVVLLLPVLYVLVLIPFRNQINLAKQSENSMKESYELLHGVFSSINEAVFIVSVETGAITNLNLSAERMFGYTREEILGENVSILHLDYDKHLKFSEMMAKAYKECGCFETSYRMRRKDGSTFPSEHTVKPLTIEDDQCKSHVCVVRDISEQVKREEDLSNLAQEFVNRNAFVESVITNLKSGIIVVDHDYRIVMLNQYAAEFSGESPELFIGKYLSEICPELQAALVSGLFVGEIPVTLFNKLQIIGYSKFDLMDNFVDSSGYIINFKELTEITKIRKELRHKDRLSAMGEVVANVAHELRNPLFAMTTVAQILEMELVLQPAQKELMDSLLKEGRRLNNLVEELLQSTKEIRLKKTRVELNSIVAQSFNVLNPIALRRKIDLKVNSFAVEIYLHSDFEKIEQVLINLLDNAMEASPEGSEVNLSIEEEVGGVVISVSDCGEGIVQDAFDKIFEVFYTTKTRGTGLGLSICRNIVDAHGGTLEARNNSDRGATFTITLPFGNDVS